MRPIRSQDCCKVGNQLVESGFAKGGKPFDWGFGGCAPDYLSLFSAAEGGRKTTLPQESDPARGDRRSRTFTISEEGRKRFHQLMMDTSSNLGDYQKMFYFKMGYFDLLRSDERLLLVNHYSNYCQTIILHTQTEMEGLVHELANHPVPAYLENLLRVMQHVVQQWQAEYDWIKTIREQELEQIETRGPVALQQDEP